MKRLWRLIKFLIPIILLVMSVALYFGHSRPLCALNEEKENKLIEKTSSLISFIEEKDFYPTEKALEKLVLSEQEMKSVLSKLMTARRKDDGDAQEWNDINSIFREWGYRSEGPIFKAVSVFSNELGAALGPDLNGKTQSITKSIAFSICRAGLEEIERLAFTPIMDKAFNIKNGTLLGAFEVNVIFSSGLTEAVQFMEHWMFTSGPGFLIQPLSLSVERLDPGSWLGDLRRYSGPPVRIDLKTRILFTIDKG